MQKNSPIILEKLMTILNNKLNKSDTALAAQKLSVARTIQTNLENSSAASFDGSADIITGVVGTLPITKGGTGGTSIEQALDNLGIKLRTGTYTGGLGYGEYKEISLDFKPLWVIVFPLKYSKPLTYYMSYYQWKDYDDRKWGSGKYARYTVAECEVGLAVQGHIETLDCAKSGVADVPIIGLEGNILTVGNAMEISNWGGAVNEEGIEEDYQFAYRPLYGYIAAIE